jgi:hypothetical protein
MKIKHEKLGLSYELPELRQRDVEAYFSKLRDLRGRRIGVRQYGEEITAFVKSLPKFDGERFGMVLREFVVGLRAEQERRDTQMSIPEQRGSIVRAAASAGWLGDVAEEAVNDMAPAAVNWLAVEVDKYIADSLAVPGE